MELNSDFQDQLNTNNATREFTDDKIPHGVFSLGDSMFAVVDTFQGNVAVHIIRYKKDGNINNPTKEGVTLHPWWIEHILGHRNIHEEARDLFGSLYPPEIEVLIDSTGIEQVTFTGSNMSQGGPTLTQCISISASQWGRLTIDQYTAISTAVLDHTFKNMNFSDAFKDLHDLPLEESLPSSLDMSHGTQYLLDALQKALRDYIKSSGALQDPVMRDCELVWENRVEHFNSTALALDVKELAKYFYESIWEEQHFLALRPAMYITWDFLKKVRLDRVLREVRKSLCPSTAFEYFEEFL